MDFLDYAINTNHHLLYRVTVSLSGQIQVSMKRTKMADEKRKHLLTFKIQVNTSFKAEEPELVTVS